MDQLINNQVDLRDSRFEDFVRCGLLLEFSIKIPGRLPVKIFKLLVSFEMEHFSRVTQNAVHLREVEDQADRSQ